MFQHKACLTPSASHHSTTDEDEEQMEKLFKPPMGDAALQRELLARGGSVTDTEAGTADTVSVTDRYCRTLYKVILIGINVEFIIF